MDKSSLKPFQTHMKHPRKSFIQQQHHQQQQQQQLESHQRREFRCNICVKDFASESLLREHEEIHVTPFCRICNKMFKSAKLLRVHEQAHHSNNNRGGGGQSYHHHPKSSKDSASAFNGNSSDEELDLSVHKIKEEPIELVSEPEIENLLNHDPHHSSSTSSDVSRPHDFYQEPSRGIWRNFTETPPSSFLNIEHSSVPLVNIKMEPVDPEPDQFDFIINEILKKPSADGAGSSKLSLVAEEIPLQQNFWTQSDNQLQQQDLWICDICNKQFSTKQILQRHRIALHDQNKDFKCDQCDAWFSSSNNHELIKHVNEVHNGFKKFICDYCNKEFSRRDALKRHRQTHENQKAKNMMQPNNATYNCFQCGLNFRYQTSLILHLKTHKI